MYPEHFGAVVHVQGSLSVKTQLIINIVFFLSLLTRCGCGSTIGPLYPNTVRLVFYIFDAELKCIDSRRKQDRA